MESVSIIYEDSDIFAVDKPAGFAIHPSVHSKDSTLTDWLSEKYPSLRGVGGTFPLESDKETLRFGVLHRLDRETSGVVLIAKHEKAFAFLKDQFLHRKVEKIYNAFLYGEVEKNADLITFPIGRSKKNPRLRAVPPEAKGILRDARTRFNVLTRGSGFTFVEVHPETGRMHQLRVHFKAIRHPVVCDRLYAPERQSALGFTRLALHARSVECTLPSGTRAKLEASLPSDFINAQKFL